MNFKFFTSAIVALCFPVISFSQDYQPFLNHSSWITFTYTACCIPSKLRHINEAGEVVIGDQAYTKFRRTKPDGTLVDSTYIREDIAARRVYMLANGADELLYDFSLETGDTIFYGGYNWEATVDLVTLDGGSRKRITLRTTEAYESHQYHYVQKWIEGVGSNALPFNPQYNILRELHMDGGGYTICSFQDGALIYSYHTHGDNVDCGASLSVTGKLFEPNIVFSPNPVVTEINIDSGRNLDNASLRLYDLQGRMIRENKDLKGTKITLGRGSLEAGVYFARLSQNGELLKSGKIIVK